MDSLAGSVWFSSMDLCSGYWQVEMDQADKEKTAFVTRKGLWQWRVMPFGLCNAPATFECLMDLVLHGLHWERCLVYLDDIIVHGRTFEEHLDNLRLIWSRLREANLKMKPSKCTLFRRNISGHVVSRDGVRCDPTKIEAVQE